MPKQKVSKASSSSLGSNSQKKIRPVLYKQLIHALEKRLKDGDLKIGDLVPSEARLMEEFGMSRVTVRRGLLELQQRGIVTRLHGKGTYITSTVPQPLQTEAHTIVETFGMAGIELSVETLSLEYIDPPSYLVDFFGIADRQVVCLTRKYFSKGAPIGIASLYLPLAFSGVAHILKDSQNAKETSYHVFEKSLGVSLGLVKHIIKTIAVDGRTASALEVKEGQVCLCMDRITRNTQGDVLEFMSFVYSPGSVSFEIELPRNATGTTLQVADRLE